MDTIHITPKDDLQNILSNITRPTTIYLKKGVYCGKYVIAADNVKIVGEERETTIITNADYAKKTHSDGREYNTFRTFTVCVTGERVVIENLSIVNSNTEPERVGQCVALSVNAKLFHADNVILQSTQDTLFTAPFPDDLIIRYSGLTDDPTYYDGFIPRAQLYMEGEAFHLASAEIAPRSGEVNAAFSRSAARKAAFVVYGGRSLSPVLRLPHFGHGRLYFRRGAGAV